METIVSQTYTYHHSIVNMFRGILFIVLCAKKYTHLFYKLRVRKMFQLI